MEKGVDLTVGRRQKKKASWRPKGKALSLLRIVELNERWQQLSCPGFQSKFTDDSSSKQLNLSKEKEGSAQTLGWRELCWLSVALCLWDH